MIPFFDVYDGEFVTVLTPETTITIEKHYYNGQFMGWNVKADGVLLETKGSKKKALKFIEQFKSKKRHSFNRPKF